MSQRTLFQRYILYLAISLLILSLYLPLRYGIPYPKPLGPEFKPNVKREYGEVIAERRPEVVLVGDSVLYLGVDQESLSSQLGRETYSIGIPGSGSAVWYLILKNVIIESTPQPKYVMVFFRDTMLTIPSYRTTGRYFGIVDDFAGRNEPLVTELAFIDQMNPLEKLAEGYFPPYNARLEVREGLDNRVRYVAPSLLFDCAVECTDGAVNSVFGQDRVNVTALNQAVEDAGRTLYSPQMMDFDARVERSFLPAMIQLAQENDITLILVRTKTMNFPEENSAPPVLREYISSFDEYLSAQEDVYFLDFGHDPRLLNSYYFDSLHFTDEGKAVFTALLAEELQKIVE
jgi:hypothetical protein